MTDKDLKGKDTNLSVYCVQGTLQKELVRRHNTVSNSALHIYLCICSVRRNCKLCIDLEMKDRKSVV